MKCDELKRKYSDITGPYYGYNEVNEAIAELKAENERLNNALDKERSETIADYYLKSEADKVIAHNKYKRCLAMAEWCNSEMGRETFACFRPRNTKEVWREEHKYWAKWRKIWFELYKKFKEAK